MLFPPSTISVTQATGEPMSPPTAGFPLGTDESGRSILALIVWGARISLVVGLAATVMSMLIGTVIGIMSGYFRGGLGLVLNRFTDWFLVIPFLPLAIVLATVLGASLVNIIVVIGITSWPGTARLVRSQTLSIGARPYLERSRALGAGDAHLMRRHILPNVMPLVLANTTLMVALAILSETTLSFLGLGNPLSPSWGSILDGAFTSGAMTVGAWWYVLPPGLCVVAVVLAFTLIGRALEDVVDPRHAGGPLMATDGRGPALEFRDVHITYRGREGDVPAVRGVDLAVAAGSSLGIAGESGSGKSTLISTVLRLQPKTATVTGQVLVDGEDVLGMTFKRLRALRWAQASIVFQGALHGLNPLQRIGEQIAEPISVHEPKSTRAEWTAASASCSNRSAFRPRAPARTRTSCPGASANAS